MINNEQRREIAEDLRRESETWWDTFPDATAKEEAFGAAVLSDLMIFVGLDDESPVHAIYARLADLIDRPTCKNLATKPADELLCSECGEHVDIAYMDNTDDYHARFCPNCGKEIVDD